LRIARSRAACGRPHDSICSASAARAAPARVATRIHEDRPMGYHDDMHEAARLVDDGKLREAAEIFRRLCATEEIGEGVRMINSVNLAVVYDKLGDVEGALKCYDFGAGMGLKIYVFAIERKAEYLVTQNRIDEAIETYEHLLSLDLLPDDKRATFEHNLTVARQRRG
jgi:tetratricopeptide (TPR) repeat protein